MATETLNTPVPAWMAVPAAGWDVKTRLGAPAVRHHLGMTGADHRDLVAVKIDRQAQHRRECPEDRALGALAACLIAVAVARLAAGRARSGTVTLSTTGHTAPIVGASSFSIAENNKALAAVGTIKPTASYSGQKFSFAISGTDASSFAIDAAKGSITISCTSTIARAERSSRWARIRSTRSGR